MRRSIALMCLLLLLASPALLSAQALDLRLTEAYQGLAQPLFLTHAGDGSGRVFIVEKVGRIRIGRNGVLNPEPFLQLDIRGIGSEQGLLGLAFAPDFAQSGRFYVNFTNLLGQTEVSRFRVSADDPDRADPESKEVMLLISQPFSNHNGGWIGFGPDGYLYIATGDGGSGGDPDNHGQRLDTLLGKILRLDVSGATATIPPDNPFVNTANARPEIWAYGLRNPWRPSFDRATGDLWIADVGQETVEEVNVQPANSNGGENYGWRLLEGSQCYTPSCNPAGTVLPVAEYGRSLGCSVTGGYVYRGPHYPAMQGVYFFGDFCTAEMFATRRTGAGFGATSFVTSQLGPKGQFISSFGEDEAGNLYLISLLGGIFGLSDGEPVTGFIDPAISGTYYDPAQDGHGWLVEAILVDGEPAVLATWYTYLDGQPVWLIGVGQAAGDRIEVPLTITRGGGFSPDFDPATVIREHWGDASFHFPGGQQGSVIWSSDYPGFNDGSMPLLRLVEPAAGDQGPTQGIRSCHSGTWYQPAEDGHGLQVQVFGEGDERELLAVWYAYLEGEQRWMIGQGPIDGDGALVEMISADGPQFPPAFEPDLVERRPWGTLLFTALGANSARISWESVQPGYGSGELDLVRLTTMQGRECVAP